MILTLVPALIVGLVLGHIWGGLYRPDTDSLQPWPFLSGLVATALIGWAFTYLCRSIVLAYTHVDSGFEGIMVKAVLGLIAAYPPAIIATAIGVSWGRKRRLRHLWWKTHGYHGERDHLPKVRDTKLSRGASNLG